MFDKSLEILSYEEDFDETKHLSVFELTMSNLTSSNGDINKIDLLTEQIYCVP